MNDSRVKELDKTLTDWINEELENERIIVKDLRDDLFDGQVLQKLFETLANKNVGLSDIRQAEKAQIQKLETVLESVAKELNIDARKSLSHSFEYNFKYTHPLRTRANPNKGHFASDSLKVTWTRPFIANSSLLKPFEITKNL